MRDRSRIHPPTVAHPVAHPSDLGICWQPDGSDALGSHSEGSAASCWPVCSGRGHQSGPPTHGQHTSPQGSGATPRSSRQAVWPRWVRHRAAERLDTAAPKSTDTRGFFGNPPKKAEAGARIGEDSEKGVFGWRAGRSWRDRVDGQDPRGGTGTGTYVPGMGDTCPRRGRRLWLRGVAKFSLKCRTPY